MNCSIARTCSECISISYKCRWCKWDNFNTKTDYRCNWWFDENKCPSQFQVNPQQPTNVAIIKNEPFSDLIEQTIQLRPQKIRYL